MKKYKINYIFCLILILCLTSCKKKTFEHKEKIKTTDDLIKELKQDYDTFINKPSSKNSDYNSKPSKKFHEIKSKNNELTKKAIDFQNSGNYKEAVETLLRILETEPKNISLIEQIIFLYAKLNDFKRAKEFSKKLLEIQKDNIFALTTIANCYVKEKKPNEALSIYLKLIKTSPNKVLYNNIAVLYEQEKKYEKAFKFYKKLADLEPSAENYHSLYQISKSLNKPNKALEYIKMSIQKSDDIKYKKILAEEYFLTKDYQKSIEVQKDILKKEKNFQNYSNLASSYILENKLNEAENLYLEAIKAFPENEELSYNLALCYYKMKDKAKMEEIINKYQKTNPDSTKLRKLKAYLGNISK